MRTRYRDEIYKGTLSYGTDFATGNTTTIQKVVPAGAGKYQSMVDVGPVIPLYSHPDRVRRRNRPFLLRHNPSNLFPLNPVQFRSCTCSSSESKDLHSRPVFDPSHTGTGAIYPYKPANRTYRQWASGQFYGNPYLTDPKLNLGYVELNSYPVQSTNNTNFALARAYGKLSAPDNDFGQIIGEATKTAALLVSPFKALHRLYHKLIKIQGRMVKTWNQETKTMDLLFKPHSHYQIARHRDLFLADVKGNYLKHGYAVINQAANRWLEYRYGARPIMWTIDDLRSEVDRVTLHPPIGQEKASYTSPVQEVVKTEGGAISSAYFGYTIEWKVRIQRGTFARVFFSQKANTCGTDTLFDLGLHPLQSVSLAYELFPLSFMLDWFIDVDSWLAGLTPHPSRKYLGNCVSIKEIHEFTGRVIRVWNYQDGRDVSGYSIKPYRVTWQRMTRIVNATVPSLPAWNVNILGLSNHTDILSAIWQRMPFFQRKR